jgi:hypothetical protein
VESEATSAATRPQPSINPYDAPYQSQLAQSWSTQEGRFDNQTPDTSRLYGAPMEQNYPNNPAIYQQAGAKKSGAVKWVLITLLCVLLVSGGIGAMVISAIHAKRDAARQIADEFRKKLEEELERARREAELGGAPPGAPPPPAPPPPPGGVSLEQYKYPNAQVKGSFGILGNDFMVMVTSDSVEEVKDYYKEKLGDPIFEDEDSEAVVFQIPNSPMTLIINEDNNHSEKTKITISRINLANWPFSKKY